ncbi:hypothetical protein [Bosea sp. (in: a-proteobacteria)]|uniref:hypothetical protein n=1 Tax=Bosea sp. (in: a-proteobacteria) TaxID=1871050 RepID=UPI003B3A03E1
MKQMPPKLQAGRKALSGSARLIMRVAEHYDGRWPIEARAVLLSIGIRICAGQREISKETTGRDCRLAQLHVAKWLDRLESGGYLEREFSPGPVAPRWRLHMPNEDQMAWTWVKPVKADDFDADAHRELGRKLGFGDFPTDELLRLRRNLALPPKRRSA